MRTTRSFKVWSLIMALTVACSGAGCSESDDSTGDDGADDAGPADPSNPDSETSDDTGSADDGSDESQTGTVSEGTADDGETDDDGDNPAADDGSDTGRDDSSDSDDPGNSETGTDDEDDDSETDDSNGDDSETDDSDNDDSETGSSGSDPSDTDASSDEGGSDGSEPDETSDDGGSTDTDTDPPSEAELLVGAPVINTDEGALGGEPYPGLVIEQSSFHQDADGSWIWLAAVRNEGDSLPCRISISATATFDSEQEIEFFGSVYGENHAPDYDKDGSPDPETAGSFFSCLPSGQTGVMVAFALVGLPTQTDASSIVDIQYGVSAEDWTDATAVESEQLTLQDVESQNGKISGAAKNGAMALTGVTAMVLPLSEDGVPLRFYELSGGQLAADATWEFETPAIDIEFAKSRVLFSYVGE
jgi:hypothetical protein